MSDTLIIGGTTYNNVAGFKATDSGDNELTFVRPTGTKTISITENGTVTEDVANYASAEISVNVQGGGSGPTFSEFTATTSVTNARAAALLLFPNPAEDKVYFAYITKSKSTWVADQLLGLAMIGVNLIGTAFRWRNGGYNSTGSLGHTYDVVIQPGDTFMVCEVDFVLQ